MKKLLIAFFAIVLLPITAQAAKFEEGKHYSVVPGQATNTPEVREYFSYYCPACRGFEPYLADIAKSLPEGTELNKTHVDFMGHSSPEIQGMLSTGLAVAEKTGLAKKFSAEAFSYLQTQRKSISDLEDVKKIYIAAGGDGATFDKGVKSFAIRGQVKRNKKVQDKLSKARYIGSVPAFVVNGKYVINAKELDRNNFMQDYKDIIAYLLTL
ncbi:thiol:disulfide interchange protein [Thalassotalea insulae]|uniref:Thiol:disulfide interchange protein n=1 Tax=Thalassotalea insulae TaxID=2056778 RepID=A0ABQ6GRH2_9GAMM|nr:thiol:disulfide interchange protein DsbA/DsbL [Thalassotalea insulae]GLX78540.1 thiol:disulfide interchange protein [Thalassotalea insulae]